MSSDDCVDMPASADEGGVDTAESATSQETMQPPGSTTPPPAPNSAETIGASPPPSPVQATVPADMPPHSPAVILASPPLPSATQNLVSNASNAAGSPNPPLTHHSSQQTTLTRDAIMLSPPQPAANNNAIIGVSKTVSDIKSENDEDGEGDDDDLEEELLLKWDDHHKSFFELAEDLCHQEQFIDVTLSCGEHNFPAHKLILSVCSPYFRNLFLRNPCKHPIVVLKDVHYKYMKLLLMYMYRGEVSCPQEELGGLLKTARGLQVINSS